MKTLPTVTAVERVFKFCPHTTDAKAYIRQKATIYIRSTVSISIIPYKQKITNKIPQNFCPFKVFQLSLQILTTFNNKYKNNMKKIKTLLLAMAALLCCTATMAYDFKADNICYLITSEEDLTVSVTYTGATYMFDTNEYTGSVTIPATVTNDGKTYKVTSIGIAAFYNCKELTEVIIPASVTRIEGMAFYSCTKMTGIVLPDSMSYIGVRAFTGCTSLKDVTFPKNDFFEVESFSFDSTKWLNEQPNGLLYINKTLYCYKGTLTSDTTLVIADGTTSIASNSFSSTRTTPEYIKSIIIPASVTTIGTYAFQNCSNLESITIPDKVAAIESYTFAGCYSLEEVTLGSSVKSIGNYAFKECGSLEEINFPEALESIGDFAFQECSAMESITLGKNIKKIGKKAFLNCFCLENIAIEGAVESIGENAFHSTAWHDGQKEGIVYLGNILYNYKGEMPEGTSLNIKEGTMMIASYAFDKNENLKEVTFPSTLKAIGDYAFRNCINVRNITFPAELTIIGAYAFTGCTGISKVTLPDNLKSLGNYSFADCENIETLDFGKGLTEIGSYAFRKCIRISTLNIPDNIIKIAGYAFQACNTFDVTIGRNVKDLGGYVFYNCTAIKRLYMMPETPPTISGGLFSSSSHYNNGTLYVPKGTLAAYKAHEIWGKFQYIEEHELTGIGDTEAEMPAIRTTAGGIMLTGADGKEVRVYDITGAAIGTVDDYAGETIMLDKGIYIVRVGNKAMKVRL